MNLPKLPQRAYSLLKECHNTLCPVALERLGETRQKLSVTTLNLEQTPVLRTPEWVRKGTDEVHVHKPPPTTPGKPVRSRIPSHVQCVEVTQYQAVTINHPMNHEVKNTWWSNAR